MASTDSTDIVLASPTEAKALTTRIKSAGRELSTLLAQAHETEAWRALGYETWGAYVEQELKFTRQRSYQLLNQAKVNKKLEAAGSDLRVTDTEARSVSTDVDTAEIEQRITAERTARAELKQKPAKRRGPQGLIGQLDNIDRAIENLERAFEEAGDDALSYVDHDTRRRLERTVTRAFEWSSDLAEKLAEPIAMRPRSEYESA